MTSRWRPYARSPRRGVRMSLRRMTAPTDPHLEVRTLGKVFPSPLGVAGGMDKNALAYPGLWSLGFGFVEVGTITKNEQEGTEGLRVIRHTADRALVNRMGFPHPGADVAAERVARRDPSIIVGLNVGRSKNVCSGRSRRRLPGIGPRPRVGVRLHGAQREFAEHARLGGHAGGRGSAAADRRRPPRTRRRRRQCAHPRQDRARPCRQRHRRGRRVGTGTRAGWHRRREHHGGPERSSPFVAGAG